jgi:hypothetical protein
MLGCWSTERPMTAIMLKFTKLNFLNWLRGYGGDDLEALSDRALRDIGLRLVRRDLNSVNPLWLA